MQVIISLILLLILSALFVFVLKKLKTPRIVSLILVGLFAGISFMKEIFISGHSELIHILGKIALVSIMFLAGLETSWKKLYKERKDAGFIALFSVLIPFILGFIVFLLLDFSITTSLIMGVCMSISAEATRAEVLIDLKKLKTKIGSALMGAGILDDLFGLIVLLIITQISKAAGFMEEIIIILSLVAYFLGIFVRQELREKKTIKYIEKSFNWLIIPFFFISIGLNFDIKTLFLNPELIAIILSIAFIGKIAGAYASKPFTGFRKKQLNLIGWSMNSRGALELAIALIAFNAGLISLKLYSSLIVMALVTTIAFPIIINKIIKNNPKIMNKNYKPN